MKKFFYLIISFIILPANLIAFEPPKRLSGINLTNLKKGQEAIYDIYQLHGGKFPIKDAYVAEFNSKEGDIIIWASKSEKGSEAEKLFKKMHDRIPNSSVFKGLKKVVIGNVTTYFVTGMGMDNYYFLIKDSNYWIGTTFKNSSKIVEEFIRNLDYNNGGK